jgi:hypothetical protein
MILNIIEKDKEYYSPLSSIEVLIAQLTTNS